MYTTTQIKTIFSMATFLRARKSAVFGSDIFFQHPDPDLVIGERPTVSSFALVIPRVVVCFTFSISKVI